MFSEISQRKQILCVITYMWDLKNNTNEYNKTETVIRYREKLGATSGERKGDRGKLGVGSWEIKTALYKINK